MRRSRSEKGGETDKHAIVRKRKTVNFRLETGIDAVPNDMKGHIEHERELAVSSTLIKERRTAMSDLVKGMDSLHYIYDTDFIHLVEDHEIYLAKLLSVKGGFVLAELLHKVWSALRYDNAEYDMLHSNNMTDLTKFLGDSMYQGVHQPVFWYKDLASKKENNKPVAGKTPAMVCLRVSRLRVYCGSQQLRIRSLHCILFLQLQTINTQRP